MDISEFISKTEERLKNPLPGREAQLKMSSLRRIQEILKFPVTSLAVRSSVLLLFYPFHETVGIVFILRPDYGGVHAGQIGLPGGKREPQDQSPVDTALRESKEEIGIDPSEIMIGGTLTDLYIPPSNYLVTPVVGYSIRRPEFVADPAEVERIIEVKLDDLIDEKNIKTSRFRTKLGFTITAPCYDINSERIWGATAMILSEFIEIIKQS